jgi:hypothetical protein
VVTDGKKYMSIELLIRASLARSLAIILVSTISVSQKQRGCLKPSVTAGQIGLARKMVLATQISFLVVMLVEILALILNQQQNVVVAQEELNARLVKMIVVQLAQIYAEMDKLLMLNASRSVRISARVRCGLKDQRGRLLLISAVSVWQGEQKALNAGRTAFLKLPTLYLAAKCSKFVSQERLLIC